MISANPRSNASHCPLAPLEPSASARRRSPRWRRTASTTPTSTSSTRAARAGAWRRASSRAAASASTRAWACARWPARRPPSPTPDDISEAALLDAAPRCAPSPPPARAGASRCRSPVKIAAQPHPLPHLDPIATPRQHAEGRAAGAVEAGPRPDPRIVQVMAGPAGRVRRGAGRARRRHAGGRRAPAGAPVGDGDRRADGGRPRREVGGSAAAAASASASSTTA